MRRNISIKSHRRRSNVISIALRRDIPGNNPETIWCETFLSNHPPSHSPLPSSPSADEGCCCDCFALLAGRNATVAGSALKDAATSSRVPLISFFLAPEHFPLEDRGSCSRKRVCHNNPMNASRRNHRDFVNEPVRPSFLRLNYLSRRVLQSRGCNDRSKNECTRIGIQDSESGILEDASEAIIPFPKS